MLCQCSHCCFWAHTAWEEAKASDARSKEPPAGSEADSDQKRIRVEGEGKPPAGQKAWGLQQGKSMGTAME